MQQELKVSSFKVRFSLSVTLCVSAELGDLSPIDPEVRRSSLNVKANSRSNKCDLIIIYLVSCSVRAWLCLTRSQNTRSKAFIVLLALFVKCEQELETMERR